MIDGPSASTRATITTSSINTADAGPRAATELRAATEAEQRLRRARARLAEAQAQLAQAETELAAAQGLFDAQLARAMLVRARATRPSFVAV